MADDILKLLRRTARAVRALQPPGEDATLEDQEAHRALLAKASKYAYMASSDLDNLCLEENMSVNLSDSISDEEEEEGTKRKSDGGGKGKRAGKSRPRRHSSSTASESSSSFVDSGRDTKRRRSDSPRSPGSPARSPSRSPRKAGSESTSHGAAEDDLDLEPKPIKKTNLELAEERSLLIINARNMRNFSALHLRNRILEWDDAKGHVKRENEALSHLFVAYRDPQEGEIERWYAGLRDQGRKWDSFQQRLERAQQPQQTRRRLLDTDGFIYLTATGNKLMAWTESVLDMAVSLKWAHDWNDEATTIGWKVQYRKDLFNVRYAKSIAEWSTRYAGKELEKVVNTAQKKFCRAHEKIVTSRNVTYALYRQVVVLFSLVLNSMDTALSIGLKFGAAVLAEPSFNPVTATGTPSGRSSSFALTYKRVVSDFRVHLDENGTLEDVVRKSGGRVADADDAYEQYIMLSHLTSAELIVRVVRFVATDRVANWLQQFFEDVQPDVYEDENYT